MKFNRQMKLMETKNDILEKLIDSRNNLYDTIEQLKTFGRTKDGKSYTEKTNEAIDRLNAIHEMIKKFILLFKSVPAKKAHKYYEEANHHLYDIKTQTEGIKKTYDF
jgi:hypothetical protein